MTGMRREKAVDDRNWYNSAVRAEEEKQRIDLSSNVKEKKKKGTTIRSNLCVPATR